MDVSALAIGLMLAFVGVMWSAIALWNMICPPEVFASEKKRKADHALRPAPPPAALPVVQCPGDTRYPVVSMPDIMTAAALMLPDDEKIVSLSEWRARDEQAG